MGIEEKSEFFHPRHNLSVPQLWMATEMNKSAGKGIYGVLEQHVNDNSQVKSKENLEKKYISSDS